MKTTLTIKGTHCNACKVLIEDIANDIKGINSCTVNFANGETEVEYDSDASLEAFTKEVNVTGTYNVTQKP